MTSSETIQNVEKRDLSKLVKLSVMLLVFNLIQKIVQVQGHSEGGQDLVDTGSSFTSTISHVFLIFGIFFFLLIVASGVWLLKREQLEIDNPETYGEKINSFGRNARLYILHIQGMSLTYGVRTILFNLYIFYLFNDGVNIFGKHLATVFFIGILMAVGSIISGIMAPFNGIVVDKLGKRWSFILGDFTGAMMILFVLFFQSPYHFLGAQIIRTGIMSIHSIAEGPFIYEQSTSKERVHLFSVSSSMSTFASMSGNLVGGVVPLGIALLVYGSAILNNSTSIGVFQIGLFVSVIFWIGSLIPAFMMKEDPELKAKAAEMSVSARLRFKNVKNWRTVGVFVLSSVFIGLGAGMFVQFFEIFFLLLFSASAAEIAIIFAIGSLFVASGNLVSPILAEKFGKVNMIVITRLVSVVFMLLLPFAPGLFLAGFFYMLRSFMMNSTGPTESALAMEVVDDEERTTLEALRQAGASLFAALGFIIGGYYMAKENFVTPFVIASTLYLVATVVFWLHFRGLDLDVEKLDLADPQGQVAIAVAD